jgi:hypothetical protein
MFAADLSDADLRGAELTDVKVSNANMDGTILYDEIAISQEAVTPENVEVSETPPEPDSGADLNTSISDAVHAYFGTNAIVTDAQPNKTYQGELISVLGYSEGNKLAIMAISDNHAILHDIINPSEIEEISKMEIGRTVTLATDIDGNSSVLGTDAIKREVSITR